MVHRKHFYDLKIRSLHSDHVFNVNDKDLNKAR